VQHTSQHPEFLEIKALIEVYGVYFKLILAIRHHKENCLLQKNYRMQEVSFVCKLLLEKCVLVLSPSSGFLMSELQQWLSDIRTAGKMKSYKIC
jgi:hypothetical protein